MSTLTAAQQAQTCPSCTTDAKTAPARYCPRFRCYCAHPSCPAFAHYRTLERAFGYVTLLHPSRTHQESPC